MRENRLKNIDKRDLARETYHIRIFANPGVNICSFDRIFNELGFMYKAGSMEGYACYEKDYVTYDEIKMLSNILARFKQYIKIKYCLQKYARNSKYREEFFGNSKKMFYKCAYCGTRINRTQMAVDHIFPVQKMMDSRKTRNMARLFGIYETNEKKNLAPSCHRCNKQKGTKMGLWVIRGLLGRNEALQGLMKVFEYSLASIGVIIMIAVFNMNHIVEMINAIRAIFV